MKSVTIPWGCWYGHQALELTFPPTWKIQLAGMADGPDLQPADIAKAFANPIGQAPIRQLAEGKKAAAIAVDDLTRPTQAYRFLPHILDELHQAGIEYEQITIVMAIGCHWPLLKGDQEKKLGRALANQFRVYNNHPYENYVDLGCTLLEKFDKWSAGPGHAGAALEDGGARRRVASTPKARGLRRGSPDGATKRWVGNRPPEAIPPVLRGVGGPPAPPEGAELRGRVSLRSE